MGESRQQQPTVPVTKHPEMFGHFSHECQIFTYIAFVSGPPFVAIYPVCLLAFSASCLASRQQDVVHMLQLVTKIFQPHLFSQHQQQQEFPPSRIWWVTFLFFSPDTQDPDEQIVTQSCCIIYIGERATGCTVTFWFVTAAPAVGALSAKQEREYSLFCLDQRHEYLSRHFILF